MKVEPLTWLLIRINSVQTQLGGINLKKALVHVCDRLTTYYSKYNLLCLYGSIEKREEIQMHDKYVKYRALNTFKAEDQKSKLQFLRLS